MSQDKHYGIKITKRTWGSGAIEYVVTGRWRLGPQDVHKTYEGALARFREAVEVARRNSLESFEDVTPDV